MKALKWLFVTVIAAMLLNTVFTVNAYGETRDGVVVDDAATDETDENGRPYLTVLGYRGYKTSVVIPSDVEGQTVKYISKSAFSGNRSITKVVIPDTVIDIGDEVFSNCVNLRTVVLPKSLEKINISAFSGCVLLSEIILPDTLTEIDDFAFEYCSMLKTLKIPASVTGIGHYAFMSCENLVLDCSENEYALAYAKENNIVTDAAMSPDSPVVTAAVITLIMGAAVIAALCTVRFIRRRRKMKSGQQTDR